MSLTIYLDHCVDDGIAEYLRQRGEQVVLARLEGMARAEDDDQVRYATARRWLMVSTNERDYVRIHRNFRAGVQQHSGIVTVPQKGSLLRQQLRCVMLLDWIAAEHAETRNRLFRWTDLQQLLNGGYTLPGHTDEERAVALGRQG